MLSCDLALTFWGIILATLIKIQTTSPFATVLEVTHLLPMLDSMANLTHIFVVFTILVHVVAVSAGLQDDTPKIPHDAITEMVYDTIREHGIAPLSQKSQSSGLVDPNPQKKPMINKYDREQVRKCIMDGWLGPVPRFPDKSFKCLFHLKCHIVDTILNNLV